MGLVLIYSLSDVIAVAIHNKVDGWQCCTRSSNNWLFRYGASIKIWVCLFIADFFSICFIVFILSALLIGKYPRKVKFCPFKPDAISAKMTDEGPVNGITSIFFLCAISTITAPGSAIHGVPAS